MTAAKLMHRTTLSSDQIFALLDLFDTAKSGVVCNFNPILQEYYNKLDLIAYQIGKGIRKPAYVATGVRKESAISLTSIGATDVDIQLAMSLSDPMSAENLLELERLETEMLQGLANEGNKNVVLSSPEQRVDGTRDSSGLTDWAALPTISI